MRFAVKALAGTLGVARSHAKEAAQTAAALGLRLLFTPVRSPRATAPPRRS